MRGNVTASSQHPHEPEIAPVLDAEGRCLICLISYAEELVSQAHDIVWASYGEWEGEQGRREPLNEAMWRLHELLRRPLGNIPESRIHGEALSPRRRLTGQDLLNQQIREADRIEADEADWRESRLHGGS